ncbi:TetR family transcriptional regulator [Oceanospirillaceae bacterium ASx5O]|nr:TetR family transcriptional regulator [Oceanospirillaceae bacterium ASx5O]
MESAPSVRRRGRPPKSAIHSSEDTRERLIRAGLAMLTEKGYSAAGLEEILRLAQVPKGSFYHYFASKEAFGLCLIDAYATFFAAKLDRWLLDTATPPLQRLQNFVDDAAGGMAKYGFRRGCLVGNLGQEMSTLPESFRARLIAVFEDWQQRTALCLQAAQQQGQLALQADTDALAAFFWTGWEGAVLRAKLELQATPLQRFAAGFRQMLHH